MSQESQTPENSALKDLDPEMEQTLLHELGLATDYQPTATPTPQAQTAAQTAIELPEKNPAPPPKEAQDALANYHEAIQSEFTRTGQQNAKANKGVQGIFEANAEDVATRLIALAVGGKSEQTRFQASKYIIDYVKDNGGEASGDPFSRLLEQLSPAKAAQNAPIDPEDNLVDQLKGL